MSTATLTPTATTTSKPPRYPWRTIRHGGKVNNYGSEATRAKGARRLADVDGKPVICERWTEDKGWHRDLLPGGAAEMFDGGARFRVPEIGMVEADGTVQPSCQNVSGLYTKYRCGGVPVVEGTGYCLTHQHVYRRINGIPEPAPTRTIVTPEDLYQGAGVLTEPLTDPRGAADADGIVTVKVLCEAESINEGSDVFASHLGQRAFGQETPGIKYWSGDYSNVYTVQLDLNHDTDPREALRQARTITDGRERHRAVKRAKDMIRAARNRPTVIIDLEINNSYELYNDVTSYVWRAEVPTPPANENTEEYREWEYDQLTSRTGIGRPRGNSWYSGEITWASDPALIGREFS
jgi:hypothetical protein